MCSVDTCNNLNSGKKLNLVGAECRKCEFSKAHVVLQGKFPYCRNCFSNYLYHKYSSCIGKTKILRATDKVLLGFSGSIYSICLLELINKSLVEERKKKTKFEVVLVFIDDQPSDDTEEKCATFNCIRKLVERYSYTIFFTSLTPPDEQLILSEDPISTLTSRYDWITSSLSAFTTETSKISFSESIRMHTLYRVAKHLRCSKIFTSETSDHLASKIISSLAVGRGSMLSSETGFLHEVAEKIIHVRPLRECSKKEVVFYNVFNNLDTNISPSKFGLGKFHSIQKLSESFITDLQQSFPSTVATITSTGSKVTLGTPDRDQCLLCQSYFNNPGDLSAEEALKFSQLVAVHGPETVNPMDLAVSRNNDLSEQGDRQVMNKPLICYPCSILIRESNFKWELLKPFLNNPGDANQLRIYTEIKDFLFD